MIARDEVRHAELAWDVLAWCLEVGGPDVRKAVGSRLACSIASSRHAFRNSWM